jgi:1-deoxy-D-xylulose-5-phosphate synthase
MVIHDIALQNLPVRICMDRGGLSGDDGPTHHGLFDIGYLRHIPNIIHMQAKDEDEFVDMLWTMTNHDDGPTAIRYPRGAGSGATPKAKPKLLEIGKGELVQSLPSDGDVTLIGLGTMFEMAEETKALLEKDGLSVGLINPRFIKPLDADLILAEARKAKVICTFEDHVLANGFGASIIELLHDHGVPTPVVRIGWPDKFVEHGKPDVLRADHGLTVEKALQKIRAHLPTPVAAG